MILTGKAKEDFLYWNHHIKNDDHGDVFKEPTNLTVGFSELDENLQYSIIIDWFDSVEIFTEIVRNCGLFDFIVNDDISTVKYGYTTRLEATKQAILKANELYNETNQTTTPNTP